MAKIPYIIQDEIKVEREFIDKIIKYYQNFSESYGIIHNDNILNKKKIIREIRKMSKIGKELLVLHYKYERVLGVENDKN